MDYRKDPSSDEADAYVQQDRKSDTLLMILGGVLVLSLIVGGSYAYRNQNEVRSADNSSTTTSNANSNPTAAPTSKSAPTAPASSSTSRPAH